MAKFRKIWSHLIPPKSTTFLFSYLFVCFTEDLSRGLCVKKADDDPRVLPLQVGHGRLRVSEEALAGGDVDSGKLRPGLEVIQSLKWTING